MPIIYDRDGKIIKNRLSFSVFADYARVKRVAIEKIRLTKESDGQGKLTVTYSDGAYGEVVYLSFDEVAKWMKKSLNNRVWKGKRQIENGNTF